MKLDAVPNSPDWLKRNPDSGVFYVVIYREPHGRLFKTTKEKSSKERARAIGEKIIATWLSEKAGEQRARATFSEIAKEFLHQYEAKFKANKIRNSTLVKANRYIGEYLTDEFGHLYMDQITVREWKKFVASFMHKNPGGNLENHWKHMNYVMNYARKCKLLTEDWDVENPSPTKLIGRVITEQEKEALFAAATPILRDQMLFASTMGMRLREHLMLSWDTSYCCHVNLETKVVTICANHSKTHKGRSMAMSPQVYEMLKRRSTFEYWHRGYKKRMMAECAWVFPNRIDRSRPAFENKSAWASAKKAAKIKGRLRYHDWRHTWLTEAAKRVRSGQASIALVCAYAGVSIQTFQKHYLHLNASDTVEVAELVSAAHYVSQNEKQNDSDKNCGKKSPAIVGKLMESTSQKGQLH